MRRQIPRKSGKICVDGIMSDVKSEGKPSRDISFVDTDIAITTVTTTQQSFQIMTPLIGSGGLLTFLPSLCKVNAINSANTPEYLYKGRVTRVVARVNLVGSEGNALVSGDLFNRIRFIIWETEFPFSATNTPTWDIDNQTDFKYVSKIHFDEVISLSAPSFDTAAVLAIPGTKSLCIDLPIRMPFEALSTTTAAGLPTLFDTRRNNLRYAFVSDSSVAPSPTLSGSVRMYFRSEDYAH